MFSPFRCISRSGFNLGCLLRSSVGGLSSVEAWYSAALDIDESLSGALDSDVPHLCGLCYQVL